MSAEAKARRGPTIRQLLLAVNAFVLLAPLIAALALRIYDTHLVQQTETRLISEAVLIGELYRAHLLEEEHLPPEQTGRITPPDNDDRYAPIEPILDLAHGLAPRASGAAASACHCDERTSLRGRCKNEGGPRPRAAGQLERGAGAQCAGLHRRVDRRRCALGDLPHRRTGGPHGAQRQLWHRGSQLPQRGARAARGGTSGPDTCASTARCQSSPTAR